MTKQPVPFDYGQEVGTGFEGADKKLVLPFLNILQSNSPQVENGEPEGAKAGMLFNNVTNELISGEEGIIVIPVHQVTKYVEWVPRDQGGGFVERHEPDSPVVKKAIQAAGGRRFGKLQTEAGNDLVETDYVYAHTMDPEGKEITGAVVISFTSTKIKPFRNWFSGMFMVSVVNSEGKSTRPPIFAHRARIKTVRQKNKKGTFYNYKIEPLKSTWLESLISPEDERHLLTSAQELRDGVQNETVQIATEGRESSENLEDSDAEEVFD